MKTSELMLEHLLVQLMSHLLMSCKQKANSSASCSVVFCIVMIIFMHDQTSINMSTCFPFPLPIIIIKRIKRKKLNNYIQCSISVLQCSSSHQFLQIVLAITFQIVTIDHTGSKNGQYNLVNNASYCTSALQENYKQFHLLYKSFNFCTSPYTNNSI